MNFEIGRRGTRRFALVVGVSTVLIATLGTAIAVAVRGSHKHSAGLRDGQPIQVAPARGTIPAFTGSPAAGIAKLAEGLPLVSNPRVVVGTIPAESGGPGTIGNVLEYDLAVPAFGGSAITKALWEGQLFAGAVADEYAASGLQPIVEVHPYLVTPDGSRQLAGGGVASQIHDQVFDHVPSNVGTTVAAAARGFGLRGVKVSTLTAIQNAVAIDAVSDAPKAAVDALEKSNHGVLGALLGVRPGNYEGIFVEIRDSQGRPMFIDASAPRSGAGIAWADPSSGIEVGR
jgi:hypothetical protein